MDISDKTKQMIQNRKTQKSLESFVNHLTTKYLKVYGMCLSFDIHFVQRLNERSHPDIVTKMLTRLVKYKICECVYFHEMYGNKDGAVLKFGTYIIPIRIVKYKNDTAIKLQTIFRMDTCRNFKPHRIIDLKECRFDDVNWLDNL